MESIGPRVSSYWEEKGQGTFIQVEGSSRLEIIPNNVKRWRPYCDCRRFFRGRWFLNRKWSDFEVGVWFEKVNWEKVERGWLNLK